MNVSTCRECGTRNRVPVHAKGTPVCGACRARVPWIVDAGDSNFDDAIDAPVPVLVDLWAPWCGPCRVLSPALEELTSQRAGTLKLVKVDVDQAPAIARRYQVQGVPALMLVSKGSVVASQVGALPPGALASWLDDHLPACP